MNELIKRAIASETKAILRAEKALKARKEALAAVIKENSAQ